jgi:hypothetical protein
MPDRSVLFWSWRALYKTRTGRDGWRTLRWKMSEEDAAKWAIENGTQVEQIAGSSELRMVTDAPSFGLIQPKSDK